MRLCVREATVPRRLLVCLLLRRFGIIVDTAASLGPLGTPNPPLSFMEEEDVEDALECVL